MTARSLFAYHRQLRRPALMPAEIDQAVTFAVSSLQPARRRALADLYRAAGLAVPVHLLPPPDQTWTRYERDRIAFQEEESSCES